MTPIEKLKQLAQEFIDGRDRSMEKIGEIEALLISEFLDADLFEELTVPVASYRPGGGEYYYDEEEMVRALQDALHLSPATYGDHQ